MGAFGELLQVYWGSNKPCHTRVEPKKPTLLEIQYEEERKDFENSGLGLKERKALIEYMGEYHKRSYNKFMYYNDWLKFTDNGKTPYWEKINLIYEKELGNVK